MSVTKKAEVETTRPAPPRLVAIRLRRRLLTTPPSTVGWSSWGRASADLPAPERVARAVEDAARGCEGRLTTLAGACQGRVDHQRRLERQAAWGRIGAVLAHDSELEEPGRPFAPLHHHLRDAEHAGRVTIHGEPAFRRPVP